MVFSEYHNLSMLSKQFWKKKEVKNLFDSTPLTEPTVPFAFVLRIPIPDLKPRRRSAEPKPQLHNEAVADEIHLAAPPPPELLLRIRAAWAEGGHPRRGGGHRAAAVAAHEAQPTRLLALALRYCRHPRCRGRRLPHQLPRPGTIPLLVTRSATRFSGVCVVLTELVFWGLRRRRASWERNSLGKR